MTGREALRLAVEALLILVRDEYPDHWSLVEIGDAGPSRITEPQIEALAVLERFGVELLAGGIDEPLPEVVEIDPTEQVDSVRVEEW